MKRDEYLIDRDVAGFLEWASYLIRGDWGLTHTWRQNEFVFQCQSLHEALEGYRWPHKPTGEDFDRTMERFEGFRVNFSRIGVISSKCDRDEFVANSKNIAQCWGEIRHLPALDEWSEMEPEELWACIDDIRRKLHPDSADTDDLRGFRFMGSGFSKIYSALVPGLPIYDSRVGCAIGCLVSLFCTDVGLPDLPQLLDLGVPQGKVDRRCPSPRLYNSQTTKYARANLKAAWLLQKMVEHPGAFDGVPDGRRVDALQAALFMIGKAPLSDNAVIKT